MSIRLNVLKISGLASGVLMALALTSAANATTTTMTFDTPPVLGATEAPGVWYTDRQAPAGFTSAFFDGDNRLKLTLDSTQQGSSGFYDTQGRKYDTTAGTILLSVQMYLDSAMYSDPNRVAGIWGTAFDATSSISAYPIIEFANNEFRGYNVVTGDWIDMGLPSGASADQWYTMQILLNGGQFEYTVNGQLLQTVTSNGSVQIGNVILQGYNGLSSDNPSIVGAGINRDIYFDNLTYATPLPAALPLFLSGGGLLGLLGLRRKNKRVAAQAAA